MYLEVEGQVTEAPRGTTYWQEFTIPFTATSDLARSGSGGNPSRKFDNLVKRDGLVGRVYVDWLWSEFLTSMLNWYALYTRPRHERRVEQELTNRGIESYLATQKVRRRWSDRYKIVEEPLFKSYLFVHADAESYRKSLQPYGALSFVTIDGAPATIPDAEVEAVRILVTSELPNNSASLLESGPQGPREPMGR